ncbi:hypothetical protein [Lactobacillus amylovorus]|uniref:hypothetical protein n=1 Tax=Lactobacillus amylovorus TaxID=1604 RepID=UPI00232FA30B|nr:hypothetical protein [Lactobacillus amylovorus]MDB6263533.1 hypothetical protein [Lactobacillus amylovorus]
MADETQNAVAGVETTTQEKESLLVYYYSDPNGATRNLRFHPIYSEIPFDELPWHVHSEKPSEDLKNPVWSNDKNVWVEDIQTGKDEILQATQDKIEALQNQQEAGTAQDLTLTKAIKALSEGQANQNKLLASMQNLMLTIAGSQKTAASASDK